MNFNDSKRLMGWVKSLERVNETFYTNDEIFDAAFTQDVLAKLIYIVEEAIEVANTNEVCEHVEFKSNDPYNIELAINKLNNELNDLAQLNPIPPSTEELK